MEFLEKVLKRLTSSLVWVLTAIAALVMFSDMPEATSELFSLFLVSFGFFVVFTTIGGAPNIFKKKLSDKVVGLLHVFVSALLVVLSWFCFDGYLIKVMVLLMCTRLVLALFLYFSILFFGSLGKVKEFAES